MISRFINDHYDDCLGKINHDFQVMEMTRQKIEIEKPECAICCLLMNSQE